MQILARYTEELKYQKQIFERLEQVKEVQKPFLEQMQRIDAKLAQLRNTSASSVDTQPRIHFLENQRNIVNIERQVQ